MKKVGDFVRDKGSEAGHILRVWREVDGNRWIKVSKDAEGNYYFDVLTSYGWGVGPKNILTKEFGDRKKAIKSAEEWMKERSEESKSITEDLI